MHTCKWCVNDHLWLMWLYNITCKWDIDAIIRSGYESCHLICASFTHDMTITHDSFIYVTYMWRAFTCDMTHSCRLCRSISTEYIVYIWHDSFIYVTYTWRIRDTHSHVTWLIPTGSSEVSAQSMSFPYDMTHSCVWRIRDAHSHVTWLIHTSSAVASAQSILLPYDMTHSYMWHIYVTYIHMWHDPSIQALP